MYETNEIIKSFDGTDLFVSFFSPYDENFASSKLKGVILGVHGFCEHSGRYQHVAQAVCDANMGFVAFDIRGHGKSGPSRGYAQNLASLILDVQFILKHVKNKFTEQKNMQYGLLGHSFGGLLATYAASQLQDPNLKLFLSSPCYGVKQHVPALKKAFVLKIADFFPKLPLPVGIQYENISTNEHNNRLYEQDPLRLDNASVRYGEIFFHALDLENMKRSIQSIPSRVTVVCGQSDKPVDSAVTDSLVPYFKSVENYVQIQGSGHEIFNEIEAYQKQAFAHLDQWIGSFYDTHRKFI